MLELGTPVVGQYAARPDPAHPTGRHSMCNASDGTKGDTGPRLSLEQGKAEFAAWCKCCGIDDAALTCTATPAAACDRCTVERFGELTVELTVDSLF